MHVFQSLRGRTRARLRATPRDLVFEGLSAFTALSVVGLLVLGPALRVYIDPGVRAVLGFLPPFQGHPIGSDVFTAGVILAIMIIPTISAVSREALLAVPDSQREAALSLGATRWETTRLGVLRYARAGIFGAAI